MRTLTNTQICNLAHTKIHAQLSGSGKPGIDFLANTRHKWKLEVGSGEAVSAIARTCALGGAS